MLDLRSVRFCDSSGLASLLAARRRAKRAGHRLVLVRGSSAIERLLAVTALEDYFESGRPPRGAAALRQAGRRRAFAPPRLRGDLTMDTGTATLAPGDPAPAFTLTDTTGAEHRLPLEDPPPATVVVVTCNHCPYVMAWNPRLRDAAEDYAPRGVRFLAVNANDASRYPADSPGADEELRRGAGLADPLPARREPGRRPRARRPGDAARLRLRRRAAPRLPGRAGRGSSGSRPGRRLAARGAGRGARGRTRWRRPRRTRAGAR